MGIGEKNVIQSKLEIGMSLAFEVEDNNGKPRVCMNPRILKDATKQRKKLNKLKDAARAVNNQKKMMLGMNAAGPGVGMAPVPGAFRPPGMMLQQPGMMSPMQQMMM